MPLLRCAAESLELEREGAEWRVDAAHCLAAASLSTSENKAEALGDRWGFEEDLRSAAERVLVWSWGWCAPSAVAPPATPPALAC